MHARLLVAVFLGTVGVAIWACGGTPPTGPSAPPPQTPPVSPAPVPPPPVGPGANGYFDALSAMPQLVHAYSLRDQGQLLQYRQSLNLPPNINYLYPNDPDPRQQDAAKVVVPTDDTSINNQVRLPIDHQPGHAYLFTWDYWMGREWAYSNTSMGNSKHFNIGKPADTTYLLWQSHWQYAAPGTLALFDLRGPSADYPNQSTIPPPVERYVHAERWTRAWWLLQPKPDGYHVWCWFADEAQPPVRIYSDIRMSYPPAGEALGKFWLEYATSENLRDIPPRRGALVSYVRNLVILKDIAPGDVPALLQQPGR